MKIGSKVIVLEPLHRYSSLIQNPFLATDAIMESRPWAST